MFQSAVLVRLISLANVSDGRGRLDEPVMTCIRITTLRQELTLGLTEALLQIGTEYFLDLDGWDHVQDTLQQGEVRNAVETSYERTLPFRVHHSCSLGEAIGHGRVTWPCANDTGHEWILRLAQLNLIATRENVVQAGVKTLFIFLAIS